MRKHKPICGATKGETGRVLIAECLDARDQKGEDKAEDKKQKETEETTLCW